MKIGITIDENNTITGFAILGGLKGSISVEITDEELILLQTKNCKYVNGKIETFEANTRIVNPTTQDKLNANLIKQNAELKSEAEKQKALNSQILLELARLKQGGED